MDTSVLRRWFDEYLDAFAACGRGERAPASLLAYYGVPLLFTTDVELGALTSDDQIVATIRQQIDQMRAADFGRSEVLSSEATILNRTSALYRAAFSRQRRDGGEIGRLTVTYLVTEGSAGHRISALLVHSL